MGQKAASGNSVGARPAAKYHSLARRGIGSEGVVVRLPIVLRDLPECLAHFGLSRFRPAPLSDGRLILGHPLDGLICLGGFQVRRAVPAREVKLPDASGPVVWLRGSADRQLGF